MNYTENLPLAASLACFGIKKKNVDKSSYDVFIGKVKIQDAVIHTDYKNVSIVPANANLAGCHCAINYENKDGHLQYEILCTTDKSITKVMPGETYVYNVNFSWLKVES